MPKHWTGVFVFAAPVIVLFRCCRGCAAVQQIDFYGRHDDYAAEEARLDIQWLFLLERYIARHDSNTMRTTNERTATAVGHVEKQQFARLYNVKIAV